MDRPEALRPHAEPHTAPCTRDGPGFFSRSPTSSNCWPRKTSFRKRPTSGCFRRFPIFALAIVCTSALYLPLWHYSPAKISFNSFPGDLIVVAYLLSLPTLIFFLAGWHSTNIFSAIGGVRVLTMLFGYEVPADAGAPGPGHPGRFLAHR